MEVFVRSGSTVREGGIGKRLKTHVPKAKVSRNDDESWLYGNYPLVDSVCSHPGGNRYEDLVLYIGALYGIKIVSLGVLSKDYHDDGGLFCIRRERWNGLATASLERRTSGSIRK